MSKYLQEATYWAPGNIDEYGEQSFSAPVSIYVRWENKNEIYTNKEVGKQQISKSIVYTKTDILENGYLYLGASVVVTPKTVSGAFLIRQVDKIPNVTASRYLRKVWL